MAATVRLPRWLTRRPYAHRGLHGGAVAENSMQAFDRAVAAGYGIECDVRPAADGVPHVFHDARLERLTSVAGIFERLDSSAVAALRMKGGGGVPSLGAMLDGVSGRVPVLVEVKTGRPSCHRLCKAIARVLDGYRGPVAVMSFDPRVGDWFARRRRRTLRGLVLSRRGHPFFAVRRRHAIAIARARPHFLARDVRDLGNGESASLCWTVRSGAERARAHRHKAQIIFEAAR